MCCSFYSTLNCLLLFFHQDIVNVSSAISVSRGSHGHCQGDYIIPVLKKQEGIQKTEQLGSWHFCNSHLNFGKYRISKLCCSLLLIAPHGSTTTVVN